MQTGFSTQKQTIRPVTAVLLLVLLNSLMAAAQTNRVQDQLEKAATLIQENRIAEAEQQLNSVLKVAPNEPAALNLLGTVRAQQGKLSDAEILLTHAIRVDGEFV